jgi:6-pyruvoyltetrahydropterin/6-carboxytetrahydropterin synthase
MDTCEISITFDWEMGHRLPNHQGACFNLHGHHYVLHVSLTGPIKNERDAADEGMVVDFQDIKRFIRTLIKDEYDHKFYISEHDPMAPTLGLYPGVVTVSYIPTAENLAVALKAAIATEFPQPLKVRLYETPGCYAEV